MKIIILTLSFELGGSERRAFLLARYFMQQGYDVEYWAFNNSGILTQLCSEEGIPTRIIPINWYKGFIPIIHRLYGCLLLLFSLRKVKADILLPHTIVPYTACGLIWRFSGAKKCIGYEGGREFGLAGIVWENLAVRLIPQFICNSLHLAEEMASYYKINKRKISIIKNGIELPPPMHSKQWWRNALKVNEQTRLVVMVANLSFYKDHKTLLQSWQIVISELSAKKLEAKLLLAGKDLGTEKILKNLAKELDIQDSVLFLGYVDDVAGLLQSADLAVYCSKHEGSPNGLLEAMASGLAVAATDNEGIRESLSAHQFLYLSPIGDHEKLAKNIVTLLLDDTLRLDVGRKNQNHIKKYYNSASLCENTAMLFVDR